MENASLASLLGRPDLAAGQAQRMQAVAGRIGNFPVAGATWGGTESAGKGPTLLLMGLIVGLVAFAWWVHPHLA